MLEGYFGVETHTLLSRAAYTPLSHVRLRRLVCDVCFEILILTPGTNIEFFDTYRNIAIACASVSHFFVDNQEAPYGSGVRLDVVVDGYAARTL